MTLTQIPIINYHKIQKQKDFGITSRHPHDFAKDLDCLLHMGYNTITFSHLFKKQPLPANPIIITFDDSYLSFYENAFENLLTREMKCVVFVPVNFIGKTNSWDVQLFNNTCYHMDKQHLNEVCSNGMEIGSHSLSHQFLNFLDNDTLIKELYESQQELESIIGEKVLSISYPFGRFSEGVLKISGNFYSYGVQLLSNPAFLPEYKYLALKRINIYRTDNRGSFIKKLEYHSDKFIRLKNKIAHLGSWASIIHQFIKVRYETI